MCDLILCRPEAEGSRGDPVAEGQGGAAVSVLEHELWGTRPGRRHRLWEARVGRCFFSSGLRGCRGHDREEVRTGGGMGDQVRDPRQAKGVGQSTRLPHPVGQKLRVPHRGAPPPTEGQHSRRQMWALRRRTSL